MMFLTRATDVAAAASFLFLGASYVADGFPTNLPLPRTFRERRADAKNTVLASGAFDVPPAPSEGESFSNTSGENVRLAATRRGALVQAAAAALSLVGVGTSPAVAEAATTTTTTASSSAPTRIELTVETDDLVRVLDYFDGDIRKVLGAIVRSPFTNVRIDPPSSRDDRGARDAILRALYSYESPEDYALQAKWVTVEDPDTSLIGSLTKKRFQVALPGGGAPSSGEDVVRTTVSLSLLEAGLGFGALSYPLGYSYYRYENYREEQMAIERKARMAAKKKAATGTEAAKKKKKADGADAEAPKSKSKTMTMAAAAAAAPTKKEDKEPKAKETTVAPQPGPPTEATVVPPAAEAQQTTRAATPPKKSAASVATTTEPPADAARTQSASGEAATAATASSPPFFASVASSPTATTTKPPADVATRRPSSPARTAAAAASSSSSAPPAASAPEGAPPPSSSTPVEPVPVELSPATRRVIQRVVEERNASVATTTKSPAAAAAATSVAKQRPSSPHRRGRRRRVAGQRGQNGCEPDAGRRDETDVPRICADAPPCE